MKHEIWIESHATRMNYLIETIDAGCGAKKFYAQAVGKVAYKSCLDLAPLSTPFDFYCMNHINTPNEVVAHWLKRSAGTDLLGLRSEVIGQYVVSANCYPLEFGVRPPVSLAKHDPKEPEAWPIVVIQSRINPGNCQDLDLEACIGPNRPVPWLAEFGT